MRCATSSPLNSARPSRESRSADEMWGMDGAGLAAMRGWSLVGIHGELEGRVRCGAFASAMPYVALRGGAQRWSRTTHTQGRERTELPRFACQSALWACAG